LLRWENLKYDTSRAQEDFKKLEINRTFVSPINLKPEFEDIRQKLINARDKIFDVHKFDSQDKLGYEFDLLFGLEVYVILNEYRNFKNRVASNDDIWRYLSVKVIPDIVHARWGLKEERYFRTPSRIWLRTIWYYIHLSWKGDKESTYEILKNNTTDTIMQLVDRSSVGYNLKLYRELMNQYAKIDDSSREIFRRVLKLNTARAFVTAPELVNGSIVGYVNQLIKDSIEKDD